MAKDEITVANKINDLFCTLICLYGLFYTGFIAFSVLAQIEVFVLWLRREDYKKYGLDLQTEELVPQQNVVYSCLDIMYLL